MSASAMGVPGWPELAFSTPSTDSIRMVLTACSTSFASYVRMGSSEGSVLEGGAPGPEPV